MAAAFMSSSQVIENIHEQLICAICLERFTNPKFLACLHTFCSQCLHRISNQEPTTCIVCPKCRKETPIPEKGIDQLPINFFINNMLDVVQYKFEEIKKEKRKGLKCEQCHDNDNSTSRCVECDVMLCGSCIAEHKRSRATMEHRVVSIDEDDFGIGQSLDNYTLAFCKYHTKNVIKYFCNTCDEAVCRVCTILEHREHQFVYPKEAIPQQKPIIENLLEETKTHIPKLGNTLTEVRGMQQTLKECKQGLISEINAKTQARIDAILVAKDSILEQLTSIYERKQKILSLQQDGVELELGKISGCCSFAENVLEFGNEVEILQIKSTLQALNKMSVNLEPEEDDTIQYVCNSDSIQAVMASLGSIQASQTFASLSYAEGDGFESARVGVVASITLHARDRHGHKKVGGDRVKAELTSPEEVKQQLHVEDNNDGTYLITFTPEVNGKHTLQILIQDKPIKDSPFQVSVINRREYSEVGSSVMKFGQYGSKRREFKSPFGVACDKDGFVYVADSYNHRIQIFGPRGEFVNLFGSHGDRKGEFNCPTDVAIDPDNRLIVCDNGNNRIQVFTRAGGIINKFGREGIKGGNFKSPWGVTVSPSSREIVVADTDNHRIQIFTKEGKFVMKFGSQGERAGQFNSPCYVAVNSDNENILVADSKNHRIQIFDQRGKFIQMFGGHGQGEGQFNHPRGLSMDIAGNIIVSDMGNHRLQVLTYAGKLIKIIGSEGNGDGQLSFPESVAVTPNGYVVVSDLSNNRIQVF
eukprot:Seg643.5 transcript_id=Seg643.5/GoldUCD/mRNA.D3Y31 product="E3 ubiquitin-protein ligase TRIM71" protein_id=Seg643.5/GoldUCD/D3Y31